MVDAVWPGPGCRRSPAPPGIAAGPAAGVGGSGTPTPKSWVHWRRRPPGAGPGGPVGAVQAPPSSPHVESHARARGNAAAWSRHLPSRGRSSRLLPTLCEWTDPWPSLPSEASGQAALRGSLERSPRRFSGCPRGPLRSCLLPSAGTGPAPRAAFATPFLSARPFCHAALAACSPVRAARGRGSSHLRSRSESVTSGRRPQKRQLDARREEQRVSAGARVPCGGAWALAAAPGAAPVRPHGPHGPRSRPRPGEASAPPRELNTRRPEVAPTRL